MNIQPDVLFFVTFVLSTLINSSVAFGWYDEYRYNIFSKPHTSEDTETENPSILSLWSKYHFLRRRRTNVDANIFKPAGLFMKRFFHYSPFILKNKNTKYNKAKLKPIQRTQGHRPFSSFGFFINAFKPLKTESIVKDSDFSESVPEQEQNSESNFNLAEEEIPSLENDVLDWPNEQSRLVPNLSEIENVETIRPDIPTNNLDRSDVANEGNAHYSDNDLNHENHVGFVATKDNVDTGDNDFGFRARHHSSTRINLNPPGDESGSSFSDQMQHGASIPTKETAKNLDLPQIVLEPVHQRASVPVDLGQTLSNQFADFGGNPDQSAFEGFSNEPFGEFSTDFNDGFENSQADVSDQGTFSDIIEHNSDFSNDGHFINTNPEESEFSDFGMFLDNGEIADKDLLSPMGSFEGSFSPYENEEHFYDEQFGGGFENFDNLDSSDIAGGEFFNDGNVFEGFFDTDQSGCEGVQTRSCIVDAECSCLGLYFCIEGTCGMRTALPIESHGDETQTGGSWLDTSAQFR